MISMPISEPIVHPHLPPLPKADIFVVSFGMNLSKTLVKITAIPHSIIS